MSAFYNEIDPYAAAWLENLIAAGHIAPGVVDRRPIQEIEPWELAGFTQCHFFAGIGIWSLALRRAGWSDDRPIWTGSCPCQPFSNAGKRKGKDDDRHLWPYWFNLIRECKPSIVVGEQVASKDGLGWFDLVSTDMERAGYAIGASDLCAAGFQQAHLRQRLYFVAVAHTYSRKRAGFADPKGCKPDRETSGRVESNCSPTGSSAISRLADPMLAGRPARWTGTGDGQIARGDGSSPRPLRNSRQARSLDNADWLLCRNPAGEPSWRPVEPGTFPLAHGIAGRVGKLRAYGNGLDFETAKNFCGAIREIVGV